MKIKQKLIFLSAGLAAIMFVLTFGQFNGDSIFSRGKAARQEGIIEEMTEYMKQEDATISEAELKNVAAMILKESGRYNLDYRLVLAIMKVESNFKHNAISSKGARGLLQVKPSHAKYIANSLGIKWLGAKTLDEPDSNIKIGVNFFSQLMYDFDNVNMALHAYNMGPTRLKGILSGKSKPKKGFSILVLSEYSKNKILLPDP